MTANPNGSHPPASGEPPRNRLPWEKAAPADAAAQAPVVPQGAGPLPPRPAGAPATGEAATGSHYFQQVKGRVHRRLIERLNLSNLERVSREQVVEAIRKVVHDLISQEMVALNFDERELLVSQVLDEIFGLGPLEPLIQDAEISDILVNTSKTVFIERHGRLEKTDVRFQDDRHLLQVIDRIVSSRGPAHRRLVADGGRPSAGRLPRERDHQAAGARRAASLDP